MNTFTKQSGNTIHASQATNKAKSVASGPKKEAVNVYRGQLAKRCTRFICLMPGISFLLQISVVKKTGCVRLVNAPYFKTVLYSTIPTDIISSNNMQVSHFIFQILKTLSAVAFITNLWLKVVSWFYQLRFNSLFNLLLSNGEVTTTF